MKNIKKKYNYFSLLLFVLKVFTFNTNNFSLLSKLSIPKVKLSKFIKEHKILSGAIGVVTLFLTIQKILKLLDIRKKKLEKIDESIKDSLQEIIYAFNFCISLSNNTHFENNKGEIEAISGKYMNEKEEEEMLDSFKKSIQDIMNNNIKEKNKILPILEKIITKHKNEFFNKVEAYKDPTEEVIKKIFMEHSTNEISPLKALQINNTGERILKFYEKIIEEKIKIKENIEKYEKIEKYLGIIK